MSDESRVRLEAYAAQRCSYPADELPTYTVEDLVGPAVNALRSVLALADELRRKALDMNFVGGGSPGPLDYSEGHYIGLMKATAEAADRIQSVVRDNLPEAFNDRHSND